MFYYIDCSVILSFWRVADEGVEYKRYGLSSNCNNLGNKIIILLSMSRIGWKNIKNYGIEFNIAVITLILFYFISDTDDFLFRERIIVCNVLYVYV